VVDHKRHVGIGRLADWLAVVERFDQRDQVQIGFQLVRDLVQNARAFGYRRLGPGILGLVSGAEREFDIRRGRARNLAELLAGNRTRIVKVLSLDRSNPLAADEIIVPVRTRSCFETLSSACWYMTFLPDCCACWRRSVG